ncbi:MAG: hypothetical protein SFX18_13545 [Pirellulales bacterium]|nr:hypothetical protein [Pirellulales bacterium]
MNYEIYTAFNFSILNWGELLMNLVFRSLGCRIMLLVTATLTIFSIITLPAGAATVLEDHFNDGVLDPAWNVTLTNATGWTYSESGTTLSVTDIAPTVINSGNGGPIATVTLSRNIPPVSDFHIDFDFSWDSIVPGGSNSVRAMQSVELRLFDSNGDTVGRAIMSDGWVVFSGSRYVGFGNTFTDTGMGSAPLADTASVDLDRSNNLVKADWDGSRFYTGVATNPVTSISLGFRYYAFNGAGGPSHLGTLNVDYVRIEDMAVPEPSGLVFAGITVVSAIWILTRRRSPN